MRLFQTDNPKLTNILKWTVITAASLGATASLLLWPPDVEFTRQYFEFGLDRVAFLLVLFTILFNLKGHSGKGLGFLFTLLLFCVPLLYKWQTADYYSTLGGLLPLRDANAYYQGAQNLIYGYPLADTAAFRPIFTSFLSVAMRLTNGNLQAALVFLVGLNAVVAYLAAREVQQNFNSNFAAALFLVLGYMFYRRFGGTLLTENLGYCLGNLALIFLIRGSARQNIRLLVYGIFLLTIGLNARAGAFLILPTLALWLGLSFRRAQGFWRPFALGALAVALGMGANWGLVKLINSSSAEAFSNYSYTLYGLAVGNKGWEQAGIDHPDASPSQVYDLAFQQIRQDPALFAKGVAGAYADYFVASKGAFSFLLLKHDRNDIANLALWALSFTGLGLAFARRDLMTYSISLAFFAGILFSVGLVPPADSTTMRAYAATIPMSCYLAAIGAALPRQFLQNRDPQKAGEPGNAGLTVSYSISGFILLASLILPALVKFAGEPPSAATAAACEVGKIRATFVIANGSSITLSPEKGVSYAPILESFRFFGKLVHPEQQLTEDEKAMILSLEPGTTITIPRMVIIDSTTPPNTGSAFLISRGIPAYGIHTYCVDVPQFNYFYSLPPGADGIEDVPASLETPTAIHAARWAGALLVFIWILIGTFGLERIPAKQLPWAAVNVAVIGAGALLALHMTGLIPLAWERVVLEPEKMQHRDGFLYAYNTGDNRISDTKFRDYPSYLYEDGSLLFQPHESQSIIAELGRGSYILKEKFLFFSTSDNSDPESNGREYTLEYPVKIRLRYQVVVFGAALLALLARLFYFKPRLLGTDTNHIR